MSQDAPDGWVGGGSVVVVVRSTARGVVAGALAVEVVALVVFVTTIRSRNGGLAGIVLVCVAFGAWFVLAQQLARLGDDAGRWCWIGRWIVGAGALVLLAAVVMPSRQSDDAFLYGIYGRILAVHHANPYRTVPAQVRSDAIERFVGRHWTHTPSYYGPVWIGWAALGTWIVPATKLSIRLLFQLTSAAFVVAIGWMLWRRTRSIVAAALFALQPLVVLSVVNGGHNDGAVALLCLAGVLQLVPPPGVHDAPADARRVAHPALAGILFGVAAMVKATALLGALGAALWLLLARRQRDGLWVGGVAGGMTAAAFVLTPGSISALRGAATETSFLSIWQTVRAAVHPARLVHGAVWGPENFGAARAAPFVAAIAVVAALVWLRPAIRRGAIGIEWAVVIGLTSYLVLGSWVMPWHLVWALPLIALIASDDLWRAVTVHCALVLGLFQAEDWIRADLWRPLRVLVIVAVPLGIVAMYAAVVRGAAREGERQLAPTGRPSII